MSRQLYIVLMLFVLICCLSGSILKAQTIYSSDGQALVQRDAFITNCVDGAAADSMEFYGAEINMREYCACMADKLLPSMSYAEIETAMQSEAGIEELLMRSPYFEKMMSCLDISMESMDDYSLPADAELNNFGMEAGIKECSKEIMRDPEMAELLTEAEAESYCRCAMEKLIKRGFSYTEMEEMANMDSELFNEIAMPCFNDVLANYSSPTTNSYISEDISGDKPCIEVPLVDYFGEGYKIKLNIDGISRYFLFDTGASDLIINREIERELLIEGKITKSNYMGTDYYSLANNEIVEADLVRIDEIHIGSYTVRNTVVAVFDDASLLCGKSFFDKFNTWELDNEAGVIRLYK